MADAISAYVLTYNSEAYLDTILRQLTRLADEVVLVDSGSQDRTLQIAASHPVRVVHRNFVDFRSQREFAAAACQHDYIFYCDCDEVPDDALVASIRALKQRGLSHSAYQVSRYWEVLHTSVHVVYPVRSPDVLPRLYDRRRCHWETGKLVHESLVAPAPLGRLDGRITHKTFETREEIARKLQGYTDLAARGIVRKLQQRGKATRAKAISHWLNALGPSPLGALIKSYVVRGGWRDGRVGLVLLVYAMRYSQLKHFKAAGMLWRAPHRTAGNPP